MLKFRQMATCLGCMETAFKLKYQTYDQEKEFNNFQVTMTTASLCRGTLQET